MAMIGNEPFLVGGRQISLTVNDFWRWAYSDLADERNRSMMAEFIVASSIGASRQDDASSGQACKRRGLLSPDGYRLEVRSAAYVQSWDMEHPDHVSFSIANPMPPCRDGNAAARVHAGQDSDAYIFCLYKGMCRGDSPLDLDLWEFYVLPAAALDAAMPARKTITLPSLMKLRPVWSDYYGIWEAMLKAMGDSA